MASSGQRCWRFSEENFVKLETALVRAVQERKAWQHRAQQFEQRANKYQAAFKSNLDRGRAILADNAKLKMTLNTPPGNAYQILWERDQLQAKIRNINAKWNDLAQYALKARDVAVKMQLERGVPVTLHYPPHVQSIQKARSQHSQQQYPPQPQPQIQTQLNQSKPSSGSASMTDISADDLLLYIEQTFGGMTPQDETANQSAARNPNSQNAPATSQSEAATNGSNATTRTPFVQSLNLGNSDRRSIYSAAANSHLAVAQRMSTTNSGIQNVFQGWLEKHNVSDTSQSSAKAMQPATGFATQEPFDALQVPGFDPEFAFDNDELSSLGSRSLQPDLGRYNPHNQNQNIDPALHQASLDFNQASNYGQPHNAENQSSTLRANYPNTNNADVALEAVTQSYPGAESQLSDKTSFTNPPATADTELQQQYPSPPDSQTPSAGASPKPPPEQISLKRKQSGFSWLTSDASAGLRNAMSEFEPHKRFKEVHGRPVPTTRELQVREAQRKLEEEAKELGISSSDLELRRMEERQRLLVQEQAQREEDERKRKEEDLRQAEEAKRQKEKQAKLKKKAHNQARLARIREEKLRRKEQAAEAARFANEVGGMAAHIEKANKDATRTIEPAQQRWTVEGDPTQNKAEPQLCGRTETVTVTSSEAPNPPNHPRQQRMSESLFDDSEADDNQDLLAHAIAEDDDDIFGDRELGPMQAPHESSAAPNLALELCDPKELAALLEEDNIDESKAKKMEESDSDEDDMEVEYETISDEKRHFARTKARREAKKLRKEQEAKEAETEPIVGHHPMTLSEKMEKKTALMASFDMDEEMFDAYFPKQQWMSMKVDEDEIDSANEEDSDVESLDLNFTTERQPEAHQGSPNEHKKTGGKHPPGHSPYADKHLPDMSKTLAPVIVHRATQPAPIAAADEDESEVSEEE